MNAADRLFLEILFVAAILMTILFVNNIFLYKQKIKDRISMMLISGIATCVFEIVWVVIEKHPALTVLTYLCVSLYCLLFVLFAALLNQYMLERLGLQPSKKWTFIGYVLPVAIIAVLCLTTHWTRLLFWVDQGGVVHTEVFFDTFFQGVVYLYMFTPLFIAIYYLTVGKNKRPAGVEIPSSLFVFGIMAPALYMLELLLLDEGMDAYENTSLPISLALVFLVTNVSTHKALNTLAKMEAVESDLRIASKIQADALPTVAPEFPEHPEVSLRASMNTAKEVGGDFYDYFAIDDYRICFLIADVSGKGTPAALFMMTAKTMIKDYATLKESTSEIFNAVNLRLCENNESGMFATAWIGILDTRTMMLQFTNAGHNYPVYMRAEEPCEMIKDVHGLFLGGMDLTRYKKAEIQLEPGDRLLLYTDGVVEAHDRDDKLYGDDRLMVMVEKTRDLPGEQVLERIFEDVGEFAAGVPQFDDITMVVLTIQGQGSDAQ